MMTFLESVNFATLLLVLYEARQVSPFEVSFVFLEVNHTIMGCFL